MSLLFLEGFDIYGTSAPLLLGNYAYVDGVSFDGTIKRTGAQSLKVSAGNLSGIRRVLGADHDAIGVGFALYYNNLPNESALQQIICYKDTDNVALCTLSVNPAGQLVFYRGNSASGGVILAASAPIIQAKAFQHIEASAIIDSAGGGIEVKVNGVTRLNVSGVNTSASGHLCGMVFHGIQAYGHTDQTAFWIDDLFYWDDTGADNNDFIGDKKVYTSLPNADTIVADWLKATGADGYAMINNVPPVDNTKFIYADAAGEESAFETADVSTEIVAIAGIMVTARAFKTDAGSAAITLESISGAFSNVSADKTLSMAPVWYNHIIENDPNTGVPWIVAGVNASQIQFTRSL